MRWLDLFNPNAETEDKSPIWYWIALALVWGAVIIAFNPGGPEAIVTEGKTKNLLALMPKMTGILLSMFFMSALLFRRCIQSPKNFWICLLLVGDMLLFASFLEIICTGNQVEILKIPVIKGIVDVPISVSPRNLALLVIGLTLVGARAIAGIGVILLAVVTVIHIANVEESLGLRGQLFLIAGYFSLLIQLKIPGMHIDANLLKTFLEDIGRGANTVRDEALKNVQATGKATMVGANIIAKGAVAYATGGASVVTDTLNAELINSHEEKVLQET